MSKAMTTKHYPVLIAGAGPVGLALAIELAYRDIRCLVVEQTDGTVDFPTTNLANTRTCEHLRRWGIADRMRFESGYPTDYPRNYLFVTRMDGYEIARFDHPANGDPSRARLTVPKARLWISKPYFDPVLRSHVATLAASRNALSHRVRIIRRQSAKSVTTSSIRKPAGRNYRGRLSGRLRRRPEQHPARPRYQIPRRFLSRHERRRAVSLAAAQAIKHGPAVQYQIINAQINGAIAAVDGKELWRLNVRNVEQEQLDTLNAPRNCAPRSAPTFLSSY